jgi:hypothetical protein
MGELRISYNVLVKNPKERRYLEDLGVDGRKALKWSVKKNTREGVDWIYVALDMNQWQAPVNTV